MGTIHHLRPSLAAQLRVSTTLAPAARKAGVSIPEYAERVMKQREARRIVRGRTRNAENCCAACGGEIPARQLLAMIPASGVVMHVGCAWGRS